MLARVDVAAVFCQYPCLNQTTLRSADAAVNALSIEFARPVNGSKNTASFLEDVMLKMFVLSSTHPIHFRLILHTSSTPRAGLGL